MLKIKTFRFFYWWVSWLGHFVYCLMGEPRNKTPIICRRRSIRWPRLHQRKGWCFPSWTSKGTTNKMLNYGLHRLKTGEKVIFSPCCGGESGIFYGRGLSCLLSTLYSEKTAFQRVFCWRTLWLKLFTDSLWGCPNYFPLARTAPSLFGVARNQTSIVWSDNAFRIRFTYASFSFFIAETT